MDKRLFTRNRYIPLPLIPLVGLFAASVVFAQGTAFTYQGRLSDSGNPANGNYDLQFKLFDTATVGTGTQQGSTVTASNVTVTSGIFTVTLDFGACASCFNGNTRFLEIGVRLAGGGAFTTLIPRQPITSTPYAIKSQNAATATTADGLSLACVNCVTSSQIASVNGSAVSGTIPLASVPAGSASYIQNSSSPQATSNFNISGNGTAGGTLSSNIVNATTQFNLGGTRILSKAGTANLFAGLNAGIVNNASENAFFGHAAGASNTIGGLNAFFGTHAGQDNTTGTANAFFGRNAGYVNTTGSDNSFFGSSAGISNTTGNFNSFFGHVAGYSNTTGIRNAFFGQSAGWSNTTATGNAIFGAFAGEANTASNNSFFGNDGGRSNTTGSENAFFGTIAGFNNTSGTGNTFIGYSADFNTSNPTGDTNTLLGYLTNVNSGVSNGTALGSRASVTQSNSLVLGSINGVNNATADTKVGIGTTAPSAKLTVSGDGVFNVNGAARFDLINTTLGGGYLQHVTDSGLWQLAITGGATRMVVDAAGNVGIGTTTPADKLHTAGDIRVGTGTTGCVKDANGTVIAGTCSSDAQLKRDITPFSNLLERLVRLQPVQFYWRVEEFKERHFGVKPSFGLIAQEVEKVLPELVTEDEQGYKAVNYAKLPLLSLQAIKELKAENDSLKQKLNEQQALTSLQQQQLQQQQQQITQLQKEMEELKKLLCLLQPQADLCKARSLK